MSEQQSAYPLCWPAGWKRTPAHARVWGAFDGTPDAVRKEMLAEVDRIALGKGAQTHTIRDFVVVSTNVPLRRDGEPRADVDPADPGVAVYFKREGKAAVEREELAHALAMPGAHFIQRDDGPDGAGEMENGECRFDGLKAPSLPRGKMGEVRGGAL